MNPEIHETAEHYRAIFKVGMPVCDEEMKTPYLVSAYEVARLIQIDCNCGLLESIGATLRAMPELFEEIVPPLVGHA